MVITAVKDIYSFVYRDGKNRLKYASKGDKLTVIHENGRVLIVENNKGLKFSINREDAKAD